MPTHFIVHEGSAGEKSVGGLKTEVKPLIVAEFKGFAPLVDAPKNYDYLSLLFGACVVETADNVYHFRPFDAPVSGKLILHLPNKLDVFTIPEYALEAAFWRVRVIEALPSLAPPNYGLDFARTVVQKRAEGLNDAFMQRVFSSEFFKDAFGVPLNRSGSFTLVIAEEGMSKYAILQKLRQVAV